jgi:UDP-N-acetylmuramoyl-L-alanyl-D-glutamate--2,6-diaminopimelate ligase
MILALTLQELLEGWVEDAAAVRLAGISLDNRTIKIGEAFVAVQGQTSHGLAYARDAVATGAVAVIHDGLRSVPELGVPCVKVAGLGEKLGELA